jgi:hypothetical protein
MGWISTHICVPIARMFGFLRERPFPEDFPRPRTPVDFR